MMVFAKGHSGFLENRFWEKTKIPKKRVKSRDFGMRDSSRILFLGSPETVFGKISVFLGTVLGVSLKVGKRGKKVRRKSYKGRCTKRMLRKSTEVARLYDEIQSKYADMLENCDEVEEIRCNVLLDGLCEGEYTSDFVCVKKGGDLMVRECVFRKYLTKPMTVKLLDASRTYWKSRGVKDWGLVIDEEK